MLQKPTKPLIFHFKKPQNISLHMFLVFHPLDLIFLNQENKIIEIKENFKPFTLYTSQKKAITLIECPHNTIKKTRTQKGDKLYIGETSKKKR